MPFTNLAASTRSAITAMLATAMSHTPEAKLSLDSLPRTPFLDVKRRQLQSAEFWYRFALTNPLVDVRAGVPVHILATNVHSSPEDGVSARRLIEELKPSTVLVQHVPEMWNGLRGDAKRRVVMENFVRVLTPCAKAAQSPFSYCRRPGAPGYCQVDDAYRACVEEEEMRIMRFCTALSRAENAGRVLHPGFILACRDFANIPKWATCVALLSALEHDINLKAIDMPLKQATKHEERVREVWDEMQARPPEEKLLPLGCSLAKATGLEIGDLLYLAPDIHKLSENMYKFWCATGFAGISPPKAKTQLSLDMARAYGSVDLRGLRAINACLSDADTGHPNSRTVAALREEYLAYSLWCETVCEEDVDYRPPSALSAEQRRYQRLSAEGNSTSERLEKALFPEGTRRGEVWNWLGEMGGRGMAANYVVPAVPHHFEGPFIPPSPQATLSSRCIFFIVEREFLPGIFRYWKRLNAAVPIEKRFDAQFLSNALRASDKQEVQKLDAPEQ